MEREIKFRAWNNGKMDYDCRDVTVWNGILVPEGDMILMQYTGLKDKNGNEIYEGDIIRRPKNEWESEKADVIAFRTGILEDMSNNTGAGFFGENDLNPEECEIIGNIYENPDLLTT